MIDFAHEEVFLLLALRDVRYGANDACGSPLTQGALEISKPMHLHPADFPASPLEPELDRAELRIGGSSATSRATHNLFASSGCTRFTLRSGPGVARQSPGAAPPCCRAGGDIRSSRPAAVLTPLGTGAAGAGYGGDLGKMSVVSEPSNRSLVAIPIGARLQWRSRFYNRERTSLSRPSIRPYR